ncbi:MAG: hypothetical protein HEQ38_05085 [Gemmatimonas sp.]|nr:hypothetical protein [Gemmatimonas sp.]
MSTERTINGVSQNDDFVPPFITPAPIPATMTIVSEDTESGFVIINVDDFDEATMTEYRDGK